MPKITRNVYDGQTGASEDIGTDCCGNFFCLVPCGYVSSNLLGFKCRPGAGSIKLTRCKGVSGSGSVS